jgi:FAD/FMN-containing dehydrogenase
MGDLRLQQSSAAGGELVRPASLEALSRSLAEAAQSGACILTGRPSSPPERLRGLHLVNFDLSNLCAVVEHERADQVISVEAGLMVAALDEYLQASNQWWPVYAGDHDTICDVISSADGGCLEHGFGGPRDLVLGLTVALAGGELISCGGKVVKNVSGFDLQKLFIGSRSSLGIIGAAHLRLFARPETNRTIIGFAGSTTAALACACEIRRAGIALSCLELVDVRLLRLLAENDSSLAELRLPDENEQAAAICLQLHGRAEVLEETVKELRRILENSLGELPAVEEKQAQALWRTLSGVSSNCRLYEKIDVAASAQQISSFLSAAGKSEKPLWQCRPARGRMQLFARKELSCAQLAALVESWAREFKQEVVAACSDRDYDWRVRRLPVEDEVAVSLKRGLKARFDPTGRLNPFVNL